MKLDWKKLHLDLVAMKNALESVRIEGVEFSNLEVEDLLVAARECNVELIALRSALEQARLRKANKRFQP